MVPNFPNSTTLSVEISNRVGQCEETSNNQMPAKSSLKCQKEEATGATCSSACSGSSSMASTASKTSCACVASTTCDPIPSACNGGSCAVPSDAAALANQLTKKKSIHQFVLRNLCNDGFLRLSDYAGKVVLIVNVASHCNYTTRCYMQMNELAQKYGDRLVILACPCNQFGHQENLVGDEIYLSLQHIRPGKGFVPLFPLTEKLEVNGSNAHPLFNFLRISLPTPSDRTLVDEMSSSGGVFSHPMRILWMPVSRADITWNFEKFLVDVDGTPFKRYSPRFEIRQLTEDIDFLLKRQAAQPIEVESPTLA